MTPQSYRDEDTQKQGEYPTSPWTETFYFCAADGSQTRANQTVSSHRYDSDTQAPTHDALSDIYNRDY